GRAAGRTACGAESLTRSWARARCLARCAGVCEAPREHGHFLGRLPLTHALRDLAAFAVGSERLIGPSIFGKRVSEEFPRRGIPRILLDCRTKVREGGVEFGALQIFASTGQTQERAVPGRSHELQQIHDLL